MRLLNVIKNFLAFAALVGAASSATAQSADTCMGHACNAKVKTVFVWNHGPIWVYPDIDTTVLDCDYNAANPAAKALYISPTSLGYNSQLALLLSAKAQGGYVKFRIVNQDPNDTATHGICHINYVHTTD